MSPIELVEKGEISCAKLTVFGDPIRIAEFAIGGSRKKTGNFLVRPICPVPPKKISAESSNF